MTRSEMTQPAISYSQSKRNGKDKTKNEDEDRDRSRSRRRKQSKAMFSDGKKSGVNIDDPAV